MLEDDTFFITEVSLSDGGLQQVAGALADHGGAATALGGGRGWLRSWVTGWTHSLDVDPLGLPQPEPIAGVGRLAEAVVDVLLERRPLEQMRRWLSRDVLGQLTAPYGGVSGLASASSGVSAGGGVASGPAAPSPSGPGGVANAAVGAGPAGAERRAPRFASRSMIRSVRLHQPAAGIVESTVVVQDGPRVRAVALRFEQTAPVGQGRQNRPVGFDWLCTALQFN
jgi:hypothetical protein